MEKFERPVSEVEIQQHLGPEDINLVTSGLVADGFVRCKPFQRAENSTDEITILWKSHVLTDSRKLLPMKRPFQCTSAPATPVARNPCPKSKVRTPFRTPRRVGLSAQTRTPLSGGAKFKSPSSASRTQEDVTRSVLELQAEVDQVMQQLNPLLAVYSEEDVQSYIDDLHQYNEVKDAAQTLLGKYAEMEQTTVAQAHEKFGLGVED